MAELNATLVKTRAKELGADLVGIASAAALNAFPPDPRWPQTPERISPYCKSVIVLVQLFRSKELGADLVGIASAAALNAFPPDPRWPQTPERISPYCKSVIVLVQRI